MTIGMLGGDDDVACTHAALGDLIAQVRAGSLSRAFSNGTSEDWVGTTGLGLVDTVFLLEYVATGIETLSVAGATANGADL